MPDPIPAPTPEPEKSKRARSVLNQAQIQALSKAEQIGLCAQKDDYAAKLAEREIDAGFVSTLLSDVEAARKKSATALRSTTSKESATVTEDHTERDLVVALQEVQSAAKQKYARSDAARLQDYLVGTRLNASRPTLEQASLNIIDKLGEDSLPGITATKITNLSTLRQAWIAADSDQGGNQSTATTSRKTLEDMIQSITDRRVTIQFAADAEWPYSSDLNHGIRKEFSVPLSMPFNG